MNKSLIYSFCGHLYEHYNSSLFNFAIPFFGIYFFPNDKWMEYYAIAGGFLMQPFGALIFSWIGDKVGRRPAITCAFFISTFPTLLIGLLPNYAKWGLISSMLLISCRILQGASIGGAFYGTLTFVNETSNPYSRNLNMGIILSMGFLGIICGMLIFRLSHFYNNTWGWRIPFIIGGLIGFILYGLRNFMVESKAWETSAFQKEAKIPFLQALQKHPKSILAVLCAGMGALIPLYIAASWLPGVLIGKGLDALKVLNSSIIMMSLGGFGILLACLVSSFIKLRLILWVCVIAWIPMGILLYLGLKNMNIIFINWAQLLIALNTGLSGSSFLLISKLFPPRYAYSGFAVPYAIGQAVLIGPTPYLASKITNYTGRLQDVCVLMLVCVILMSITLLLAKPYHEENK